MFDPMSPFKRKISFEIETAQWKGDNLDEMKRLLAPYVEGDNEGPFVYSTEIEPYFLPSLNRNGGGYNLLQFEAWGDDQEVDPGMHVVIYSDGDGEVMSDEQFNKMGFNN
jgi:hypothetical protein